MEQEILIQVQREREKQEAWTREKECKLPGEVWVQTDPGRKPSSWEPGPGICNSTDPWPKMPKT